MAASTEPRTAGRGKNGRAEIDAAHAEQGTPPGVVPGVQSDPGPQDVYDGDPDEMFPETANVQLSLDAGGKKPTATQLRLIGGKLDIEQVFTKGQTIELRITATVGEVAFVDEHDKVTGQVIGCQRRHKARIDSVAVA
jgi:hypothetical protein